ncbi:hypothetical protein CHARACLAT_030603 [Characodon lateralis]|uniref:Uncharacterized protein n=1 Tax=Characodon lateralis TaxID=208331 RepID=A0ABU7F7N2_9TELE|nr:hypothetical protein [Characodon lateralis]
MWHFGLWDVQDVAVLLSIWLYVCHLAGAISVNSSQRNLVRSVQEDVFFSVDVTCSRVPTIRWTFMSGVVSRSIGTWQPGVFTNITVDYSSRVNPCDNGSMGLSDLRLQDSGYYVVTVEDPAGNSRDVGFVLRVNGESSRLLFGRIFCNKTVAAAAARKGLFLSRNASCFIQAAAAANQMKTSLIKKQD